jgi:hypothetical protein
MPDRSVLGSMISTWSWLSAALLSRISDGRLIELDRC